MAGNKLAWRPAQYGRSEGPGLFVQAERLRLGPRLGPGRRPADGAGGRAGLAGFLCMCCTLQARARLHAPLGRSLSVALLGAVLEAQLAPRPSVGLASAVAGSSRRFSSSSSSEARVVEYLSSPALGLVSVRVVALRCVALRCAERSGGSRADWILTRLPHTDTHSHSAAGRGDRSPEIQSVVVRDLGSLVKQSKRARTRSRKRVKLSEGRNRIVLGRALCGVGGFIAIEQAHLRGRVSETGIGDDVVLLAQS